MIDLVGIDLHRCSLTQTAPPHPDRMDTKSRYLNNRIEQDHRRIKRRIRSMLGFKSQASTVVILSGIEMIHMMRKRQARYAYNPSPSIAEQFDILAA
ncbi:DDE-type integrase/transposase/recombinase [Mesorhizobium mediterraneum]|uniref:DDE-type integrase/transposase/recombinase n=1 Tax=Mesorhizobium mediterraneum TaxID=43617 RepID=UPI003CC9D5B4